MAEAEAKKNELSEAEKLNKKGLECLENNQIDKAVEYLTQAIKEDPS